jgi:putative DNA methylase
VVFASLIPDPDDPECPASFRTLVNDLLPAPPNHRQDAGATPDTPRNRCLEFIKHLVRWENSNNKEIIEKARKLIAAAHKFLHPDSKEDMPKVLDPFAGGGAIPLEALRLGCEAHAIELNPVAHLIELCTLVYPQKYGQPNSRPTPDYIKKLQAAHESKDGDGLFSKNGGKSKASGAAEIDGIALKRLPLISEAEYQKNPLAADVKFWGHWVLEKARDEIGQFYPPDPDGSIPVAYLWARTVKSPNPACGATIPLIHQLWLCNKPEHKVALRMVLELTRKHCRFEVTDSKQMTFDPDEGTMQRGQAACPFCQTVCSSKYLQQEGNAGRIGQEIIAVITVRRERSGKQYRSPAKHDEQVLTAAASALLSAKEARGHDIVPQEPLKPWSSVFNAPLFGMTRWGDLFNARQALTLATLAGGINKATNHLTQPGDGEYTTAVVSYLAVALDRAAESNTSLGRWIPVGEKPAGPYGRQALAMVWDYCEVNLLDGSPRQFSESLDWVNKCNDHFAGTGGIPGSVSWASATAIPLGDDSLATIITDPPYYDAVPYSDLSDFFYVWLKRTVGDRYPNVFRTPLTPKQQELVSHLGKNYPGERKTADDYEQGMASAFGEMHRTLVDGAVGCVMFAHKTTIAWEAVIAGMLRAGLGVTGSWPFHTERPGRLRAHGSAALASSVTLVFRKRHETAGKGYWDDVRDELREVARERLDYFWRQGIRGADFFISAIGPALSVYGRYAKVTRLTGEEVSVGQFLDEVRGIVTDYALSQILHGAKTGQIDSETRFYVLWKWSYADAKVPADEAFKLAQALGISTEQMWDRTGVLEKQSENVQALTTAKRMRISDLGEPNVDGSPAPLIDALHRCCAFRDKGDTGGLSEYLARSGHGRNEKLWTVAQAMSEVLSDGDKEKQLLQGLLNQRDKIDEALAEERLF